MFELARKRTAGTTAMGGVEQVSAFSELDGGDVNVMLMLCFAALLAWSNGANDIANSVGTVRARILSRRVCCPSCTVVP